MHGPQIVRDIVAAIAVAARGAYRQPAILVNHRNRDAVAYWHDRSHQPRMTTQTLVVFRDGARVFRLARRLRDESWHHLAVPQHVVGDDEPARPREIDEAVEHRQVRALVAVLKDQIEWAAHFRQHQRRVADHDGDAVGDARLHEVLARLRCPLPIPLHRHQHPVGRKRSGEPDPRIANRRADLEDSRRADRRGQHAQEPADFCVHQWKALLLAGTRDLQKHGVGELVQSGEVSFDGVGDD